MFHAHRHRALPLSSSRRRESVERIARVGIVLHFDVSRRKLRALGCVEHVGSLPERPARVADAAIEDAIASGQKRRAWAGDKTAGGTVGAIVAGPDAMSA